MYLASFAAGHDKSIYIGCGSHAVLVGRRFASYGFYTREDVFWSEWKLHPDIARASTVRQERLFAPLRTISAGFGLPADKSIPPLQPWGHDSRIPWKHGGRSPKNVCNPSVFGPAGSLHMALEDLAKFASLYPKEQSPGIISHDSIAALHDPTNPGPPLEGLLGSTRYAAGWGVAEHHWAGGRVLQHSGSNTMWYSVIWFAPERILAFMAAINTFNAKAGDGADIAIGWSGCVELIVSSWWIFDLPRAHTATYLSCGTAGSEK